MEPNEPPLDPPLRTAMLVAMLRDSLPPALVMLGWSCSCLNTVVSLYVKENQD